MAAARKIGLVTGAGTGVGRAVALELLRDGFAVVLAGRRKDKLDEVAREFGGEDVLRPIMRGILEEMRRVLSNLHEVLNELEPLDLTEPSEEEMALARTYFDKGVQLMSRI